MVDASATRLEVEFEQIRIPVDLGAVQPAGAALARARPEDGERATASAASKTSFAVFGNLLIGAIVAAIGGSLAVQRRLNVTQGVVR